MIQAEVQEQKRDAQYVQELMLWNGREIIMKNLVENTTLLDFA